MTEDTIRIIRSMSLSEIEHFIYISKTLPSEIRFEVKKRLNELRHDADRMMPMDAPRMDTGHLAQP